MLNLPQEISRAVVWDSIIQTQDKAKFSLKGKKAKYPLSELYGSMKGKEVTLTVQWDIMPLVGFVKPAEGGTAHNAYKFTLPDKHIK